mmetsp:Transcript_27786/g.89640  ORF Transcript_27786/g.89640 Transcript_27786/m.89640 type:complete len:341 (+) Transcript_27786:507-1529(+)
MAGRPRNTTTRRTARSSTRCARSSPGPWASKTPSKKWAATTPPRTSSWPSLSAARPFTSEPRRSTSASTRILASSSPATPPSTKEGKPPTSSSKSSHASPPSAPSNNYMLLQSVELSLEVLELRIFCCGLLLLRNRRGGKFGRGSVLETLGLFHADFREDLVDDEVCFVFRFVRVEGVAEHVGHHFLAHVHLLRGDLELLHGHADLGGVRYLVHLGHRLPRGPDGFRHGDLRRHGRRVGRDGPDLRPRADHAVPLRPELHELLRQHLDCRLAPTLLRFLPNFCHKLPLPPIEVTDFTVHLALRRPHLALHRTRLLLRRRLLPAEQRRSHLPSLKFFRKKD